MLGFYSGLEQTRFAKEKLNTSKLNSIITQAKSLVETILIHDLHQTKIIAIGKLRTNVSEIKSLISANKKTEAKQLYKKALEQYRQLGEQEKARTYAEIKKIQTQLSKNEQKE